MRKLVTNEIRLLVLFSTAIFLALNLFAARAWMQYRSKILADIAATNTSITTGKAAIEGAEAVSAAKEWIKSNPPPACTAGQASNNLLMAIRAAAEEGGLKILQEEILPAPNVTAGSAVALQIKISGPFSGVAKFFFALQDPKAWRSVAKMVVRSESEPPNVMVDMELRQYYVSPANSEPGL